MTDGQSRFADRHGWRWRVIAWYVGECRRTLAYADTEAAAQHTATACAGRESLTAHEREGRRIHCPDRQQITWEHA